MRLTAFFAIAGALLLAVACKKDNDGPPNLHYDYFPLTEGHFVTYTVQEVRIDYQLLQNDTLHYFLKTVIGDTLTDNSGRVVRRFERYVRDSLNHPWVLQDIWTSVVADGRAELVEENQRVIKMVFAPTKFKEWNANAFNNFPALDCYYRDIHLPSSINGFSFDSTLVVEQEDFKSLIDFRRKYERYAKDVGMIYKHFKDYKIQNFDTLNVTKGREVIMELVDYGVQ